ncbi:MAG: hypothetical protein ACR2PA_07180 [Hyphomicrobiaceae bacterium]
MRFGLIAIIFALAALQPNSNSNVWARETKQAQQTSEQRAEKLDELFAALKQARTEQEASVLTPQIWALWNQSGHDDVDLMMRQARQSFSAGQHGAAIARVDEALRLLPRYSEAWNLRATILFYMGRDVESVVDIERTLAIEPRHFGALAGLMMINMRAENWNGALKALRAGLQVHPFLQERQLLNRIETLARGKEL